MKQKIERGDTITTLIHTTGNSQDTPNEVIKITAKDELFVYGARVGTYPGLAKHMNKALDGKRVDNRKNSN